MFAIIFVYFEQNVIVYQIYIYINKNIHGVAYDYDITYDK